MDEQVLYTCPRCGADSSDPSDAAKRRCRICECSAVELAQVPDPAEAFRLRGPEERAPLPIA